MNELKINSQFKDLIRPLSRKEYLQLEENLLADGCRDPIVTWKGYIIDGHNRYEICTNHQIPFNVIEMNFDCQASVISWICKNQLGRRNITEETRKFLIGMQYESEKVANGSKNPRGLNQYSNEPEMKGHRGRPESRTAKKIAEENNVTHATVHKYAIYTRALEEIGEKVPDMLPKILSGTYKISHNNIVALSKLDMQELHKINRKMERTKKPFVQYCNSRNVINETEKNIQPIDESVKSMPKYDPDAAVTELALTAPSWIGSIKRTIDHSDRKNVSSKAKNKLSIVLSELKQSIDTLLDYFEENNNE